MSSVSLFTQVPIRWERPRPVEPPPPQPREREEITRIRESLGDHAREVWSGREHVRRAERQIRGVVPTGFAPFDALLGGGLPKGKLLELTGPRTSGRWSAVMTALAGVTSCGEPAALIDHGRHFDPQVGAKGGIELARLLWIAPATVKDAVAAAEILLATGFPLVAIDLGLRLRGKRVGDAAWLRLARAAESYGAVLLVSSPFSLCGMAAEGAIRAGRARPRWSAGARPPLLEGLDTPLTIERHRHAREGTHQPMRLTVPEAP